MKITLRTAFGPVEPCPHCFVDALYREIDSDKRLWRIDCINHNCANYGIFELAHSEIDDLRSIERWSDQA